MLHKPKPGAPSPKIGTTHKLGSVGTRIARYRHIPHGTPSKEKRLEQRSLRSRGPQLQLRRLPRQTRWRLREITALEPFGIFLFNEAEIALKTCTYIYQTHVTFMIHHMNICVCVHILPLSLSLSRSRSLSYMRHVVHTMRDPTFNLKLQSLLLMLGGSYVDFSEPWSKLQKQILPNNGSLYLDGNNPEKENFH